MRKQLAALTRYGGGTTKQVGIYNFPLSKRRQHTRRRAGGAAGARTWQQLLSEVEADWLP